MNKSPTSIEGHCHCGNINYSITTELTTEQIIARACDCSFCRVHGAKNWSEPHAQAAIRIRDKSLLQEYYFGLKLCPFYICKNCGAYAGAVYSDNEGSWATLNLRLSTLQNLPQKTVSFAGENTSDRISRRKAVWMPVTIEYLNLQSVRGLNKLITDLHSY